MPTRKRYAARLRVINADGSLGDEVLLRLLPLGTLPAVGGTYYPVYSGAEPISQEDWNKMGFDCDGTGTAPGLVTYTVGNQYGLRAIQAAARIVQLSPRYEKARGIVVVVNAVGGYPQVKLTALEGQAFSDTGVKQPNLEAGTPPGTAQFYLDYQNPTAGLYRVDTWPAGANTSTTTATSETVRVAAGSGQAPVVSNRYPDQVASEPGDKILLPIAGAFMDPDGDALTYSSVALNTGGQPTNSLPEGLSFNPTAASPYTVTATMPNQKIVIRITATDKTGLSVFSDWLLTVNRKTLTGLALNIPSTLDEGKGFQATATASYSDNSTVDLDLAKDARLSLAGPDGKYDQGYVEKNGVKMGANGLTTADVNTTVGDDRLMQMKVEYGGRTDVKTFLVNDKTTPVARKILSIDFEYVTQNGSSYLLWYIMTNFGIDGLQMAISWPNDPTYGAQAPGQWLNSASATDPTYRILRDAPVTITAHFRDTNSSAPEISFTVNRPTDIRGNAARVRVYTA